jgi:hypothetical protein
LVITTQPGADFFGSPRGTHPPIASSQTLSTTTAPTYEQPHGTATNLDGFIERETAVYSVPVPGGDGPDFHPPKRKWTLLPGTNIEAFAVRRSQRREPGTAAVNYTPPARLIHGSSSAASAATGDMCTLRHKPSRLGPCNAQSEL